LLLKNVRERENVEGSFGRFQNLASYWQEKWILHFRGACCLHHPGDAP
jgi:hypothetical protein